MKIIREWLLSREPRERMLIMIGGILLVLTLIHLMIWSPLAEGFQSTKRQLHKLRTDVAWMRSKSKILAATARIKPIRASSSQGSLPTIIDRSARTTGIINRITKVEPRSNDTKVQVNLTRASFTSLLRWIEVLYLRHKINISQIIIIRGKQPGLVNVSVTFARVSP